MDIIRTDAGRRAKRRRIAWTAGTAGGLCLLLLALSSIGPSAPAVARSSLWFGTVAQGEMIREVRGPGTLVPREIRWITSETGARVERVLVRPGATVTADTIILELSNPEVQDLELTAIAELRAAEAEHLAKRSILESQALDQKAEVSAAIAALTSARLQADAEHDLVERGIIPRIRAERSRVELQQLELKVQIERERAANFDRTLSAQIAADQARLDQTRNAAALRSRQAAALRVAAGIDGVLQQVAVQEGQQVAAGTSLARVAKPGDLMAELRIPETQVKDVAVGQTARIDTRNGVVPGTVVRIDPAVVSGSVLVEVDFTAALPASARPDLSVDGAVEIERLDDVLYMDRPANAQAGGTGILFRLDPGTGVAERVQVGFGRTSVNTIEIRGGLQPGDHVILSDLSQWAQRERLRVE